MDDLSSEKTVSEQIRIIENFHVELCQYWFIQKLYEWHFDIYGLINAGLAIDVTTLPENPYQ